MKTYIAEEGKVFKKGDEILGHILYTPDDFDDSDLKQIDKPEEEEEFEE